MPRDRHYQRIALSPWGNYSFRVLAQNSAGVSEASQPTTAACATPPDVPHINPRAVCTTNLRPNSLVVTWQVNKRFIGVRHAANCRFPRVFACIMCLNDSAYVHKLYSRYIKISTACTWGLLGERFNLTMTIELASALSDFSPELTKSHFMAHSFRFLEPLWAFRNAKFSAVILFPDQPLFPWQRTCHGSDLLS